MSALKWADGETCRRDDVVQWPGCTSRQRCTQVGEQLVLLWREGGEEYADVPAFFRLLHRVHEAEDRDREKYEYCDDFAGTPPDFYDGWEMSVKTPPLVFRRLRRPLPPAAPAKPPLGIMPERLWLETRLAEIADSVNRYDEAGMSKPVEWANEASRLEWSLKYSQPYTPPPPPAAPAKPRRMKGTLFPHRKGSPHAEEHDELEGCSYPPACHPVDGAGCEPVDPTPAPAFDATVWPVEREQSGEMVAAEKGSPWGFSIRAYVGNGYDGYTIAAFCETKALADECADSCRFTGRLPCRLPWHTVPLLYGRPLPFAVAVKVVTK